LDEGPHDRRAALSEPFSEVEVSRTEELCWASLALWYQLQLVIRHATLLINRHGLGPDADLLTDEEVAPLVFREVVERLNVTEDADIHVIRKRIMNARVPGLSRRIIPGLRLLGR
jgi:hypothetical protein